MECETNLTNQRPAFDLRFARDSFKVKVGHQRSRITAKINKDSQVFNRFYAEKTGS